MNKILEKFDAKNSLIILDKSSKEKIIRSVKNIPNIKVTDVNHFSSFDVIKFKKIIFTETSMRELEKKYA
jgi:large subunit ribosomal protein L4